MITAHLPAGYVTGRCFASRGPVLAAALLGGFLPDFDLIWFYWIDHRAFHHHAYWVHIPVFWAVVAALCLPLLARWRQRWLLPATAFFTAIFVHLLLDSISGDIKWLWPWNDRFFHLVTVPPVHGHWVLNFLLHPVMLLEIAIWCAAIWLWTRRARSGAETPISN